MSFKVVMNDHYDQIMKSTDDSVEKALTMIGIEATRYAKKLCAVDTGYLRNSISYAVSGMGSSVISYSASKPSSGSKDTKIGQYSGESVGKESEKTVYIGTNVLYAPYVEFGTGNFSTLGTGTTKKQWIYIGEDGETHIGHPVPARPFLKPAMADHTDQWRRILGNHLKEVGK